MPRRRRASPSASRRATSTSSRTPTPGAWAWSYHIRVENGTADDVQLLGRHWIITDGHGRVEQVRGDGVVGDQPVIAPGGGYDYVSGCPLPTSSGTMVGTYTMAAREALFDVAIPLFSLDPPDAKRVVQLSADAMKRTHLPLNALRVFDAAARHLSFTKAADELAVTPAAVGQQIRALEDVLGTVLFKRMTRNLELTPEAERALPALRAGFLAVRGVGPHPPGRAGVEGADARRAARLHRALARPPAGGVRRGQPRHALRRRAPPTTGSISPRRTSTSR